MYRFSAAAVLFFAYSPGMVKAADCGCDHTITADTLTVNGGELGIKAGETICIEAGKREFLRLENIEGSKDSPVTVKNCGGQVEIDNAERGYGLVIAASKYLKVTGTGDDNTNYGFLVRASRTGPDYSASCIIAGEFSTDFEIDHIEAYDCGFAGLTTKNDPTCAHQNMSDFVQYNTILHHLYLHNMGGEGIYFGNTGYPSRKGTCDGKEVDLIPHSHEGVWIYDNIIEDTGWDGAQIGVSPKDCYFYRNRIARVGLKNELYQNYGLQIGGGSACEISNNYISTGSTNGVIVLDSGNTNIYNNVVTGFSSGIYINDRDSEITTGVKYRVAHNTVIDTSERGISIFGARSKGNVFLNNLVVNGGTYPINSGKEVDLSQEGNLEIASLSEAKFTDPGGEDYSLVEGSPAIDQGAISPTELEELDIRGALRDDKPDVGAYEFGADAPANPSGPPDAGSHPGTSLPPNSGGGDAADGAGCGCELNRSSRSAPAFITLALLGLTFISRRRQRKTQ